MVVSIDGLLALLAATLKQTCHFYYLAVYLMLFVENKFFFLFFFFSIGLIAF